MGVALILIGFLLLLLTTWNVVAIVLIVVGVILFFVPAAPYGYSSWHGRPPPP
jgi:membrane-bound ClpP family serine protease